MTNEIVEYKYFRRVADKYWTVRRSTEKDIAFTTNEYYAIALIEDLKLADKARKEEAKK